MGRELLMIPGPTNVDPAVLEAMAKPPVSHMSPRYGEILRWVLTALRKVFATDGEVFVLAGSGTVAQEAGAANIVEPGDDVLCLVHGQFGERLVEIVKRHGGCPDILGVEWGKSITADFVRRALGKKRYKAVTAVHVDTSTGVSLPLREICEVVSDEGPFFIVDTVCSLGGVEVKTDEWGIDVNCSCSQKCLAAPPGLALLALSKRVMEFISDRKEPVGMYFSDVRNWVAAMHEPERFYFATPPVNMIYALEAALKIVLAEGLDNRFRRHHVMAEAFRKAIDALSLRIVAEDGYAADTVTAVYYPKDVEDQAFRSEVARKGVVITRGFGPLQGRVFRVGHMGNVDGEAILATVEAIEAALNTLTKTSNSGVGVKAAKETLHP